MQGWHWLAIEAALAVIALRVMARRVLPALRASPQAGDAALLIDVWLPLTMALPMIILAGWVGLNGHHGWTAAIGGPPLLGLIALALACMVGTVSGLQRTVSAAAVLIWCAAGAVLLLLGAAHQLTIFAGQCAFAIAAVLLWQNTPMEDASSTNGGTDSREPQHDHLAAAMLGNVLLAAGIGACCVMLAEDPLHAALSQSIAIVFAACALAAAARRLSFDDMLRVGGWTATYGLLFALGIMSLTKLSPIVAASLRDSDLPPLPPVARGMGMYAPEAMALLALGGLAFGARAIPSRSRRILGMMLLTLLAAWLAWRLADLADSPGVWRL